MDPLPEKFSKAIAAQGLIRAKARVLVAVSGGLDSMVLLHLLLEVRTSLGLSLAVVHVHHGIRGAAADQDERFVREIADGVGLPYYSDRFNAVQYAKDHKLSLEESARILRYRCFHRVLARTGYDVLATAHTADDQAETVLDHFLRGSGSAGLRGMPARRGQIVRPLLAFRRSELQLFAESEGVIFREDASNQDLRFKRNRIRHELLPYLGQHFNPKMTAALNRSAKVFDEVERFLRQSSSDAFKSLVSLQKKNEIILEIDRFLEYNTVVQKYVLLHCCEQLGIDRSSLDFDKLANIVHLIGQRQVGRLSQLSAKFWLQVDHDGIVIFDGEDKPPAGVEVSLAKKSKSRFGDYEFRWTALSSREAFTGNRNIEYFDRDLIGDHLKIQACYPGAFFYPLNLNGRKKVSDFFSDCKVPLHLRGKVPILESEKGIVWICGYRIDNRFKVTDKTHRLLKVEIRQLDHDD